MSAPVRILVLTSSTGGGHDARAQAFVEWVYQLYRGFVDVRVENLLERSSVVGAGGVAFYNWIQKRAPWLHTPYYMLVEGLGLLNRRTVSFGRAYYVRLLREYRPHLVFSVHDCLNKGYFQLARKLLGPENVRCTTYCGEFSGGFGYSFNWVDRSADLYFSRTATARDFAVKLGMPRERTRVRGHLMRPRSYTEVLDAAGRARMREHLGLRPDVTTFFLATGGNGANNHRELLPTLARYPGRAQAVVICGRNVESYNDLLRWRSENPEFACHVEGYSESVPTFLQISDAIVTRGGTTTCAKALHFRCPIIFNGFGGIMPQERLTVKFFQRGAGSPAVATAAEFAALVQRWMEKPATYAEARRAFEALRYEEDPIVLINELVDLACQPAGVRRPVR